MSIGCFIGIPTIQIKLILTVVSFSVAFMIFGAMQKFKLSTKLKITFIYAHLVTLFFPFVMLTTSAACGITCSGCYQNIYAVVGYSLPTTLVASMVAGFVVIPSLFVFSSKKNELKRGRIFDFVKKYSKTLNIKNPKLYIVNKAEPLAFSFRSFKSAIFLSVGVFDLLTKREIEAVVLHELAHIKQKSSVIKFSNQILNIFSPISIIARFNHDTNEEEILADFFVVEQQRTDKFISSAKRKFREFEYRSFG